MYDIENDAIGETRSGKRALLPRLLQLTPSSPNSAIPAPIIPPMIACVVETGSPNREHTKTHSEPPEATAAAIRTGSALPISTPLEKTFNSNPPKAIAATLPMAVVNAPHRVAD